MKLVQYRESRLVHHIECPVADRTDSAGGSELRPPRLCFMILEQCENVVSGSSRYSVNLRLFPACQPLVRANPESHPCRSRARILLLASAGPWKGPEDVTNAIEPDQTILCQARDIVRPVRSIGIALCKSRLGFSTPDAELSNVQRGIKAKTYPRVNRSQSATTKASRGLVTFERGPVV